MAVLVLFATIEGQTEKIATFVADEVVRHGYEAVLINVDDAAPHSFEDVDAVILAAPVHQRRHPKNFEAYVAAHRQDLGACRTLLLSVSLSAAFEEGLPEAKEYVTEMKMRTGLLPDFEALVAGAVRTTQYDYFAMQVIRHVVLRGHENDPGIGDHEFTDWENLAVKVAEFLG